MTFPNARDCEHGHQRGKCVHCDLAECETYRDTILGQRQDMAVEISRMRRRNGVRVERRVRRLTDRRKE